MNTCQTSIKPVYCYNVAVDHVLSLPDKHESTTVVPTELNKGEKVKLINTELPNTYHMTKLRKLS